MRGGVSREDGFTLVELLVATAMLLALMAVTGRVLLDVRTAIQVTSERADLQQRARVALEALALRIRGAGAGADHGAVVGRLAQWVPVVWPGRPEDRAAFATGLTTIEVLASVPAATLRFALPRGAAAMDLEYRAGCAAPCGFFERMTVLLLDADGDFDLYVLTAIDGGSASARRLGFGTDDGYAGGSAVLPVDLRAIYFDDRSRELRAFDGDRSDLPIVNEVADLQIDYLGQAVGETLETLDSAALEDGPWRGTGAEPYDADLLRLRSVRVMLRLQAGTPLYRGTHPSWFRHPGIAVDPARMVKDVTLRTTIAPRNIREGA